MEKRKKRNPFKIKSWVISIFSFLPLVSCGYHLVSFNREEAAYPVAIHSIKNDLDGAFENALVAVINQTAILKYTASSASRYSLDVRIVDLQADHTDFQYQTNNQTGSIINRLSPVGGQHDLTVEVKFIDKQSQENRIKPFFVRQVMSYDFSDYRSQNDLAFFDLSGQSQTTLSYSLGQLAAEDDAKASAKIVLYQKIARKIVSRLISEICSREKIDEKRIFD